VKGYHSAECLPETAQRNKNNIGRKTKERREESERKDFEEKRERERDLATKRASSPRNLDHILGGNSPREQSSEKGEAMKPEQRQKGKQWTIESS